MPAGSAAAVTTTERAVALCADDYGYRPGVSARIRDLAASGRISATSALVTFADWPQAAAQVATLRRHVDVGLHVNLTEGAPLGPMPRLAPHGRFQGLGHLVLAALSGPLDPGEIAAEVERQFAAFSSQAGSAPDFVDGHQHAHALPGIRDVVIAASARAGVRLVRDPADAFGRILRRGAAPAKALAIAALARGFGRAANDHGLLTNDGFGGVYDLGPSANLRRLFAQFVVEPGRRHLVMCHPGDDDATSTADPIAPARRHEAEFLARGGFAEVLAAAGLRLVRFTQLVG